MNYIQLTDKLMALKQSNSFGDQVILIVDISQDSDADQRSKYPYVAGKVINSEIHPEGQHIPFSVERIEHLYK